jgi:hypothetical protein
MRGIETIYVMIKNKFVGRSLAYIVYAILSIYIEIHL